MSSSFAEMAQQAQQGRVHYSKDEYREKKQAERDSFFEQRNGQLSEVFADGNALVEYLDAMAKFPNIREGNLLMIMGREDVTYLKSKTAWEKVGRALAEGAQGIPMQTEPNRQGYTNVFYAYDVSQTTGKGFTPPAPCPSLSNEQMQRQLITLCNNANLEVRVDEKADVVRYDPSARAVIVGGELDEQAITTGLANSYFYHTIAESDRTPSQEKNMLQAQAATRVFCTQHGHPGKNEALRDTTPIAHVPVLKGEGDLLRMLGGIRDAVNTANDQISKQLVQPAKAVAQNRDAITFGGR